MANNPIQTILNNNETEIFNEFKGEKSTYQALRDLVNLIPKFNQEETPARKEIIIEDKEVDTLQELLNRLKD